MIELKFKNGNKVDVVYPIILKDSRGNKVYSETESGYYVMYEFDDKGNETYNENSHGHWAKREYDINGNETSFEDANGYWVKREFDENGNKTYYENSDGSRKGTSKHDVVEMTMEEVCKSIGKNVKVIK